MVFIIQVGRGTCLTINCGSGKQLEYHERISGRSNPPEAYTVPSGRCRSVTEQIATLTLATGHTLAPVHALPRSRSRTRAGERKALWRVRRTGASGQQSGALLGQTGALCDRPKGAAKRGASSRGRVGCWRSCCCYQASQ